MAYEEHFLLGAPAVWEAMLTTRRGGKIRSEMTYQHPYSCDTFRIVVSQHSCLSRTALPSKTVPITTSRAHPGTIRRGILMFWGIIEVPRPEPAKEGL